MQVGHSQMMLPTGIAPPEGVDRHAQVRGDIGDRHFPTAGRVNDVVRIEQRRAFWQRIIAARLRELAAEFVKG